MIAIVHKNRTGALSSFLIALMVSQVLSVLSATVICEEYHSCHVGILLPAFN